MSEGQLYFFTMKTVDLMLFRQLAMYSTASFANQIVHKWQHESRTPLDEVVGLEHVANNLMAHAQFHRDLAESLGMLLKRGVSRVDLKLPKRMFDFMKGIAHLDILDPDGEVMQRMAPNMGMTTEAYRVRLDSIKASFEAVKVVGEDDDEEDDTQRKVPAFGMKAPAGVQ